MLIFVFEIIHMASSHQIDTRHAAEICRSTLTHSCNMMMLIRREPGHPSSLQRLSRNPIPNCSQIKRPHSSTTFVSNVLMGGVSLYIQQHTGFLHLFPHSSSTSSSSPSSTGWLTTSTIYHQIYILSPPRPADLDHQTSRLAHIAQTFIYPHQYTATVLATGREQKARILVVIDEWNE